MEPLSQLRDSQGHLLFTRTYDDSGNWVGLYYTKGKTSDFFNLPDLAIKNRRSFPRAICTST